MIYYVRTPHICDHIEYYYLCVYDTTDQTIREDVFYEEHDISWDWLLLIMVRCGVAVCLGAKEPRGFTANNKKPCRMIRDTAKCRCYCS